MSIIEFKNNVNLITNFVARMNEEAIPTEIKKAMVKVYANTLRINLSDRMVDSFIDLSAANMHIAPLSHMARF
jgi:hypothetical protein